MRIFSDSPLRLAAATEELRRSGYHAACEQLENGVCMESAIACSDWEMCVFHWKDNSIFLSIAANTLLISHRLGVRELLIIRCVDGSTVLTLLRDANSHISVGSRGKLETIYRGLGADLGAS